MVYYSILNTVLLCDTEGLCLFILYVKAYLLTQTYHFIPPTNPSPWQPQISN